MTQLTEPATLFIILLPLSVEGVLLFFLFRKYYSHKIQKERQQFAGYLKNLDEENRRLKQKISELSNKKLRRKNKNLNFSL